MGNARTAADGKGTHTAGGVGRPSAGDAADLQRLIRYVERWRMSTFQRADVPVSDPRLRASEMLLRKLYSGLQLATAAQMSRGQPHGQVYLY